MKNLLHPTVTLLSIFVFVIAPLHAGAEETSTEPAEYSSPVIITEVQTGAGTAGDEFVELYNAGDSLVDIEGWQLRYVNASSTTHDTTLLGTVAGAGGITQLAPQSYFVFHTSAIELAQGVMGQAYTAKLSSSDKAVALFAPDAEICRITVRDAVSWGASTDGEDVASSVAGLQTGDRLVQRYRNADGKYVDSNHNTYDTKVMTIAKDATRPPVAQTATPGTDNALLIPPELVSPEPGAGSNLSALPIDGCTVPDEPGDSDEPQLDPPDESPPATIESETPEPEPTEPQAKMPTADIGLKSPQISELLPNPAKPQTDAADEFVELYNSNNAVFDLSGFMLATSSRKFTFPQGTNIEPRAFKAFFSSQTHLSLSNSAGQVSLLDPFGNIISQSGAYGTAKDNQAWALAAGNWLWTITLTPNASNVIKAPITAKKAAAKTTGAKNTGVKGVSTSKQNSTAGALNTSAQMTTKADSRTPLHPGVLALVGGFALLYGAYEYRSDMANKIHQLQTYRAARREARQSAKRQ